MGKNEKIEKLSKKLDKLYDKGEKIQASIICDLYIALRINEIKKQNSYS